jgi:hypothetical protein
VGGKIENKKNTYKDRARKENTQKKPAVVVGRFLSQI